MPSNDSIFFSGESEGRALECGKGADAIAEAEISSEASAADGLASGELPLTNKLSFIESFDKLRNTVDSRCIFIAIRPMDCF